MGITSSKECAQNVSVDGRVVNGMKERVRCVGIVG